MKEATAPNMFSCKICLWKNVDKKGENLILKIS